jgi:DnaJ-class molecular chaperone
VADEPKRPPCPKCNGTRVVKTDKGDRRCPLCDGSGVKGLRTK